MKRTIEGPRLCGCVLAAAVLMLGALACDSDSGKPADAGAADLQVGDAAVDQKATDQGSTGTLSITVVSQDGVFWQNYWLADTASTAPLSGATVAADLPDGRREELTTGADGKVTFEDVGWPSGTAAVTAHADGHIMRSLVGISEADGEQTLYLLRVKQQPEMVEVSGTAQNLEPDYNNIRVGATAWGYMDGGNKTDYTVLVEKGKPFALYGMHTILELTGTQDTSEQCLGWTKADHQGATGPITLDLDFADKLTPVQVTGTFDLPATDGSPLAAEGEPSFSVRKQGTSALLGLTTTSTKQQDGTFAFEGEYIELADTTGIQTTYHAMTLTYWDGSFIEIEGYPEDGAVVSDFLDVPNLEPASYSLQPKAPIAWSNPDPDVIPMIHLYRQDTSLPAWIVEGMSGASSLTLPEVPSTVVASKLVGEDGKALGRVHFCADLDVERQWCARHAHSSMKEFGIFHPKTVSFIGLLQDYQTNKAVADAEVCVMDEPAVPCVATNIYGIYNLPGVPNDRDVILTFTKTGYIPVGKHHGMRQASAFPVTHIVPEAMQADVQGAIGEALDDTKGSLFFVVLEEIQAPHAGATIKLEPQAGTGPFYIDTSFLPDASLNATSDNGRASIWNVPPGDYTVTVSSPSKTCEVNQGWPDASADTARVKSVANMTLTTVFYCQ